MSILFNKEQEMKTGHETYPVFGLFGGVPYSEIEILNSPITPKENMLRFIANGDYEWIPDTYSDLVDFTPDINPDTIANGFDGGIDSFGVRWEPLENGLPAMPRPGHPLLDDIANWRSILDKVSDPDSWDWEKAAEQYRVHSRDRMHRGCVPTGLFERLIDVLEFEEAAIALIEQPDTANEFLEYVTDYNLKVMKHFFDDFKVDAIFMSDDWSSQKAPFFSESAARECLFPHLKRMVDYCHDHGAPFTLHSCGNGVSHIPVWLEAGIDAWQFQESAIDIDAALEAVGDQIKMEGYWIVPEGLNEEQTYQFIHDTMHKYCRGGKMFAAFCDADYLVPNNIRRMTYEVGRKLVNEMK